MSSSGVGDVGVQGDVQQQLDIGAYLVLERYDDTLSARRIPLNEHFHLYVDEDGDVRADHSLKLWIIPAVRLHYRMQRR